MVADQGFPQHVKSALAIHLAAERALRAVIAAEIEAFADDHSDVSDAYRHAALIAKGIPPA